MNHNLEIEKDDSKKLQMGYRIVDIAFLMSKAMTVQATHSRICTGGMLQFKSEDRKGLVSTLIYKCNICDKEIFIKTEDPKNEIINKALVWGTLATGSVYEHTSELLSILDIPSMSRNMFFNVQRQLGSVSI